MTNDIGVFHLDPLSYYLSQPNLSPDWLGQALSKKINYLDNCIGNISPHPGPSNITKSHLEKLNQYGFDQGWTLFDLIRVIYYETKHIRKNVIEYVLSMAPKGILERLAVYFGQEKYAELCRGLITNFRSNLDEFNWPGESGFIKMTLVTFSDLNRAGFKLYIKNFSEIQNAEEDHPEYYCQNWGNPQQTISRFQRSGVFTVVVCWKLIVSILRVFISPSDDNNP